MAILVEDSTELLLVCVHEANLVGNVEPRMSHLLTGYEIWTDADWNQDTMNRNGRRTTTYTSSHQGDSRRSICSTGGLSRAS
ncbi:hypothetical protein MJO28_015602 [Puccinia striiformis f. sp. tritici]|uniref:Uncharacterized protein n=1 Tax=Puccinia striiformis f. sp. tritici TaxID=168172 RepID=A0ACC0DPA3_9BASI|nr:hypothetical protein MJO29_015779 [Puccinia striiformis f. sp. tritici]KAI7936703.1 hypothetical protein MJO28_015602 [Puccinia striiformis f. sp. tritici]